jgi:hypothetical protein
MDCKAQNEINSDNLYSLFTLANRELESSLIPTFPSCRTISELSRFDYKTILFKREQNTRELCALLNDAGVEIVSPINCLPAGFVVIRDESILQLRQKLATQKIFCPIHWPKPVDLPDAHPWRSDVMSLPIDHRYDLSDMHRLAEAIIFAKKHHE